MNQIILINRNDIRSSEIEEQNRFIFSTLERAGVDLSELDLPEDLNLSVEDKIKLRSFLNKFEIKIINQVDGEVTLYVQHQPIAKWFKPKFVLKQDPNALERSERMYVEMHTNTWTVFDESTED